MWLTRAGASARAYSSAQMICCDKVAPRPPCSTGHPSPMNPARPSSRSQRARVEPEVLVTGTAASAQLGVLPDDVLRQPPRDVAPELLVVVRDLDVRHRGVRRWSAAHELDPHAIGVHQEHDVGAEVGTRLIEDERSVFEHPLGSLVDIVHVEAQVREAELVAPLRRRADDAGLVEREQLDAQIAAFDDLRRVSFTSARTSRLLSRPGSCSLSSS